MQPTETPFTQTNVMDLSFEAREKLLDGPTTLFIVSSSGISLDYDHQCSVAKAMVSVDWMRQLQEQRGSHTRPFAIEFPARALAASSPIFKQYYELHRGSLHVPVQMGNVLPGYIMCVLDWYGRALKSKSWYEFLPEELSMDNSDRWYWVYCYAAMQLLGMREFAMRVQRFIESILGSLVTDRSNYAHLLRSLRPNDPILSQLARITAQKMNTRSPILTNTDQVAIVEHFPRFADAVNALLVDGQLQTLSI
jgi:hypothetical protein